MLHLPDQYALGSNYPNPFNPSTTITYDLPEDAKVRIVVYNIMGQVWPGTNEAGQPVPSGIYIYRLVATPVSGGESFTATQKMVLLK